MVMMVGHCKARGTAAGVRLPVTLAVACSIIYADLNLMEHMCVSAADILPRLARKAGAVRRPLGGMRGPDGLMTKLYHSSALRARTQLCMYALSVFIRYGDWLPHAVCTVCTQQCKEAVMPGELDYTKTLLSFQAAAERLHS